MILNGEDLRVSVELPQVPYSHRRSSCPTLTVRTEVGDVRLQVPRDRQGSFTPQIVPKHARRVAGFDEAIISLYAKGLTTGEIQAHPAEIYDVRVSRDLVSRVTDKVAEELAAWQCSLQEWRPRTWCTNGSLIGVS